jgi:phosphopantetheine--protein transferase-like protein
VEAGPEFSVSHSEDLLVVAVSRHAVGVDVEKVRDYWELMDVAERVFPWAEVERIQGLAKDQRVEAILKLWTKFEAAGKVLGSGITSPNILKHFKREVWSFAEIAPAEEFVGTVAVRGVEKAVVLEAPPLIFF